MAAAKHLPEKCNSSVVKDDFITDLPSNLATTSTIRNSLRVKNKFYKEIINTTNEGFFITDFTGNFLDVNQAYCKMIGYTRKELLSMALYDVAVKYINYDREEAKKSFLKAQSERNYYHQLRYFLTKQRCKNGEVIDISASIKHLDVLGGITFHFNRDVTEELMLKNNLAESEELYRCLVELGGNVGDAVVMLKDTEQKEGKQVFVSNKWVNLTGYSKEELLDKSFFDLICPIEKDISIFNKKITGENILHGLFELNILQKDGNKIPVEIICSNNFYKGEQVIVIYIRDISMRKHFEDELKKYQLYLQDLVYLRTDELQKANIKLEKSYEEEKKLRLEIEAQLNSKINLVRAMVHELKTPLTPIIGTSEILMDKLLDNSLKRMVKNINRGAENLNRRITDLMDYVSGTFDEIKLQYDEMDPIRFLSEIISYVSPEAEIKKQNLVLNIKRHLPTLYADEDRLRQVLINLLNNASKFTPSEGYINVNADIQDNKLLISIEDNGCGIAEEVQPELFNYKKALEFNHRKQDSFGIGLPLSKMLIELHGGEIWFESNKNQGSKFSFYIPVKSYEDVYQ